MWEGGRSCTPDLPPYTMVFAGKRVSASAAGEGSGLGHRLALRSSLPVISLSSFLLPGLRRESRGCEDRSQTRVWRRLSLLVTSPALLPSLFWQ